MASMLCEGYIEALTADKDTPIRSGEKLNLKKDENINDNLPILAATIICISIIYLIYIHELLFAVLNFILFLLFLQYAKADFYKIKDRFISNRDVSAPASEADIRRSQANRELAFSHQIEKIAINIDAMVSEIRRYLDNKIDTQYYGINISNKRIILRFFQDLLEAKYANDAEFARRSINNNIVSALNDIDVRVFDYTPENADDFVVEGERPKTDPISVKTVRPALRASDGHIIQGYAQYI